MKCVTRVCKNNPVAEQQFGLRSISYIGAKLWNDLPNDFKETSDFTDFKSILDTWTGPDLDDPFLSYV